MSDTETEETAAETVIEYIEAAVDDLRVTQDYLSYATVLEVNLENPQRFTDDEKSLVLSTLNEVLIANLDITEEIGWDIPAMILPFFELDWDYDLGRFSDADALKSIMHVFDTVAKHGNAKEMFVKSIELLTGLDYTDNKNIKAERILDIKFYALLELLSSSLKRINTVYPSKFLSMALSCLVTCFVTYTEHSPYQRFIARKLYTFARDYIPPLKPLNWLAEHGLTQEEANKLDDDENYLQRKLLQSFITQVMGLSFKIVPLGFAIDKYKHIKINECGKAPNVEEKKSDSLTSTRDLVSRITALCASFDLELDGEFEKLRKESVKLVRDEAQQIVKNIKPKEGEQPKDEQDSLIEATVGLAVNDSLKYTFHPDQTKIPLSAPGLLLLCTKYYFDMEFETTPIVPMEISLLDAICIYVRFLSPCLVSAKFNTKGRLDSCMTWVLTAMTNAKPQEFNEIPKHLRVLFLQTTIYNACTDSDPEYRFILFTMMVRMLANIEEDEAYSFIIDTLSSAPLEQAKAGVVNVLKDFLIRERAPVEKDVAELGDNLKKTLIKSDDDDDDDKKKKTTAPPLPKRHLIELTPSRVDDIYALTRECLDDAFAGETIDGGRFKTLLGFLNLLVGIRSRFPQDLLSEIVISTKKQLGKGKTCEDESTNVEFANVAIDSLSGYIGRMKRQT